jgi:L-arabinokinase
MKPRVAPSQGCAPLRVQSGRVSIVFYISGHGFGHASRQIEVVNALFARRPDARIVIRSSAARWLFDRTLRGPAELQPAVCDTGAVQRGSLDVDVEETIRQAAAFHAQIDPRIDEEARVLDAIGAEIVIGDVPPLAFAAAARAGVPSIALSNFTWDWIYDGYAETRQQAPGLVERLGELYAQATEAWRLPLAGGFETMRRVTDWPFIARHARHTSADVRDRLGLPRDEPLLLVSFGGYGAASLDVAHAAATTRAARIVITSSDDRLTGAGVLQIDEDRLYGSGLRYEDLVGAVDIVLTKPGYGIVSECIANRTRLLYTSRGRFREYEIFVDQMPRYLPCEFLDQDDLVAGRWQQAAARLLAQPELPPSPTDGAARAADQILSRIVSVSAP